MTDTDIPEGFERQSRPSPLTDPWEPIYSKQTPDAIILGLRLATPHTNARGFAHGGLIAALTDKAMGHSCGHKMRGVHSLVTVSMAIDFVSSAQIGQWLDGRDRRDQDRQHALLRTVSCQGRRRRDRARQRDVSRGAEEGVIVIPGRRAASNPESRDSGRPRRPE